MQKAEGDKGPQKGDAGSSVSPTSLQLADRHTGFTSVHLSGAQHSSLAESQWVRREGLLGKGC